MKYVTFQTQLFFTDIPDDQLDAWFVGGDCAGWFYARLLPVPDIQHDLDPTMEDWGWIMAVKVHETVVSICVWEHLDKEKEWVLGISSKKKWLRKTTPEEMLRAEEVVVNAVSDILKSDSSFSMVRWSTEHPGEVPPVE